MASAWPTNKYRRHRLRQSRDALLDRTKSQQALLYNLEGIIHPNEIIARLQKVAPCIEAQLLAASNGKCAHSSRNLVIDEVHMFGVAAKHLFSKPVDSFSLTDIKHEQRGNRKASTVNKPPPPPPPPHDLSPAAITCEALEKALQAKTKVQYIVVEIPTFLTEVATSPPAVYCDSDSQVYSQPCESALIDDDSLVVTLAHLDIQDALPIRSALWDEDTISIRSAWCDINPHAEVTAPSFEATAAESLEEAIEAGYIYSAETILTGMEDCSESLRVNNNNIGAIPLELSNNQLDFFDNLKGGPMLCEVVSTMWGDTAQEKHLRAERSAALRARWVGRNDNPVPWLPSPHVSTVGQYTTDPKIGECGFCTGASCVFCTSPVMVPIEPPEGLKAPECTQQ